MVALEADLAIGLKDSDFADGEVTFQCDFSLREAVIRDKIADPTEFLTQLFGPVPGPVLERMESRTSVSSDSSSFSFLSRDDIQPPLLRPSLSRSSRLDMSSQLSGRLTSKQTGDGSTVTINSLDLSVSSARFILLPRTLLRLEHFVLDVFLAASKKRSELEIQRDEALANNPPGVDSSAYVDVGVDPNDSRGERHETRFTVPPLRQRSDSISESLKDDLNAVRSAFMSPLQRMLSSASAKEGRAPGSFTSRAIAEETGSGASVNSKTKDSISGNQDVADRKRVVIPQWKVDARFVNLQMWVVSTDRKADVAGCVLSSQLIANFDSALGGAEASASLDESELVSASVMLSKVEVLVGSPKVSDNEDGTLEPQPKPTHHTGTLVESFEVDAQVVLRQCFRPVLEETIDPESSEEKSDQNSDSNSGGAESGVETSDEDVKATPWINTPTGDKGDSPGMDLPELFVRDVPLEWQEWILSEPTVRVNQIISHIAYRDLPLLLKIFADVTATRMRKCECVIDVLVERGCKYFVVRSTLILENQTSSDLEVEFVPPQRRSMSRSLRSGNTPQGHIIPIWKKIVKASSVVPVPVHIVSSGEGYVMVRPPEINGADDADTNGILPKAYAKERVHLPLFDRGSSSANENVTHMETDEFGQAQCTIKFRRLYSDRPVRPFMMNICLSNASSALYHRTLSFHPLLIVHNLTAGPLDFCLATPSDWSPAVEAVTLTNSSMNAGWETREQRLRERGTINVADSLIWHLSSEETPLELSVRMKGFDWSEPLELEEDLGDLVRIKMKDLVSDAYLYITAEIRMSKGHCRELFLYVPYWIVNLTGLKLEYEYEEERMGGEHKTTLLAGQKRLDRDELLLKENQRAKTGRRERNPHLLHPVPVEDEEFADEVEGIVQQNNTAAHRTSPDRRESERKRRHPRLLPSVPPVKGLLDLLPKTIEYDPRSLGQLEVLQACHSDYRTDRGCVRLRVSNERDLATLEARKESGQRKWSDPFVLDQAGTIGEIEADDFGANRKFSIGYSIIPAKGQYSRTKVIMLTPRFMLINTMSSAIEVCHSSSKMVTPSVIDIANASGSMPNSRVMSPVNPVVQLDAGAFADFHWTLRFAKTRTIRCRFTEYGWSWSGAVPLVESGEYAVRMRHESTRESKLVRVTLKLDSSCVCVYFREERTTAPPYRVENYSLETLRTHQHRVRRSEILLPHHSLDYAWDEPTEERLLVVDMLPSAAGDNSRPLRIGSFDLDKIQRYPDALGGTLGIEISTDGPTRVLRFTDTRLRGEKNASANVQVSNDQSAKSEVSQGGALQLLQRFVTAPTVHAALHLQGVGISIVDNAPKELVYVSISGIALEILISDDGRSNSGASIAENAVSLSRLERETRPRIIACCLEVNDVQVDNQLQVTPYPVLLRFSNPNGRSRIVNGQTVSIPVLQLGLVKHDEYAGIEFIRHFSVSVLPVHIRVDGALLYQLLPLLVHAKIYGSSGINGAAIKKRAVVIVNGDSSSNEATRAAHSHLLLADFNASLEVSVKVLEAAQKDNTTSAGPTSDPTTPTMKIIARRNSNQQQLISPRQKQHTALATEIQRYSAAKYGSISAIAAKDEQKKLYFEEFYIDPIRATVSFSFGDSAGAIVDGHLSSLSHAAALTDPTSSRESPVITVGPLRLILNAIGTSLTKIANAPFQLKALHIHNSFVQPDVLATRLASHYQSEALRQAYVILGSVDVLGNPMIAWKNLRSGFQDFIAEPAHGLSQRSPQAFAFGVGRGSLSLVRASVYTFLDFNTRILTAFSLGLSEACLKLDDYTGYPATRHIFQGLVQGVSGVVVAPIHSFEVNGARGVLPGIVAGAFGVVLKPLLGFSLATATTASTLRDAVDPNTKALLVRVRPPRHIDLRTKRLKVYSYVESLGEEIVGKIRGGRYRVDGYVGHVDLKTTHQCFLVTRKRILFLNVKGKASAQTTKYDVEWELLAEEVVMVDCSRTPKEQIITIYYMEDEFRAANGAGHSISGANGSNAVTTSRRRTPGIPRGMFLQKHEVALPDSKVLFVRAMLQQQERSLLTKMNSYTKGGTPHHVSPMSSLARTDSMELSTAWQPQHPHMPLEYPIFRLPLTLHQTRSFANLAQTTPSHHHYNQQRRTPTDS
ncbi:putative vacuolar protein sorting-associated protein 13A [Phytophthora ramorum]|uniref:putative vacuolar protein sorting-associated protein 13A n=1 Tax=Phytophthora ramorum TaxID=164328 RepID=UPI0030A825CE|nr:putative vacuolar protein sorting-associated protein 13A [Phytophthora ramorum]